MDLKNASLHKAVTQALEHVTPQTRATARFLDELTERDTSLHDYEWLQKNGISND